MLLSMPSAPGEHANASSRNTARPWRLPARCRLLPSCICRLQMTCRRPLPLLLEQGKWLGATAEAKP